jgi:hypothetical protein
MVKTVLKTKYMGTQYRIGRRPIDSARFIDPNTTYASVSLEPIAILSDPVESAKLTYPIGQPLLVIVRAGALDSLNREVCGKSPTDKIRDGRSEAEHVEEDEDNRAMRWISDVSREVDEFTHDAARARTP